MNRGYPTLYNPDVFQRTRIVVPERRPPPPGNQIQPTRVAEAQQTTTRRHQPHYTGYSRDLERGFLCRCADPVSHGDAFSLSQSGEQYQGIAHRDPNGRRMSWGEEIHRILDALGKDYASLEEAHSTHVSRQVYNAETVQALQQERNNARWLRESGEHVRTSLPHDAIWHGRVNPRRCSVLPPPETPGLLVVGAHGCCSQGQQLPRRVRGCKEGPRRWGSRGARVELTEEVRPHVEVVVGGRCCRRCCGSCCYRKIIFLYLLQILE